MKPTSKIQRHELLLNPLVGLSPLLALLLGDIMFSNLYIGMNIGMYTALVALAVNYFTKANSFQPLLIIFTFNILNAHLIYEFFPFEGKYTRGFSELFANYFIIACLITAFAMRPVLVYFFRKNFSGFNRHMEGNLREFYFVSKYLLLISLFRVISLYTFDPIGNHYQGIPQFMDEIQLTLIAALIAFEVIRVKVIVDKLKKEDFLPVVNESGVVIGKEAKSVSLSSTHKSLHPVVRVYGVHQDGILLRQTDSGKWEPIIYTHVQYGENMDQAIERKSKERFDIEDISPRFLLKHVFEMPLEKQYILLYYTAHEDTALLMAMKGNNVKLWPFWQIDENLGKGAFSEVFEVEYDYLKNTVLLAQQFGI